MVYTNKIKREGAYFGILTAVITILSFIIGLIGNGNINSVEIISSIVAMSVSDSMADAYGVYEADKIQDDNITDKQALIGASYALFSKLSCQLIFIIPFLFMSDPKWSAVVCTLLGICILIGVSKNIATTRNSTWAKTSFRILSVTGVTTILSISITKWISSIKNKIK